MEHFHCFYRITAFQDSWPKMEKWFTKFGTLKKVDAAQGAETVFLEVENILEDTVKKVCKSTIECLL